MIKLMRIAVAAPVFVVGLLAFDISRRIMGADVFGDILFNVIDSAMCDPRTKAWLDKRRAS